MSRRIVWGAGAAYLLILGGCVSDNDTPQNGNVIPPGFASSSSSSSSSSSGGAGVVPDDVLELVRALPIDNAKLRSLASTILIEYNHPILALSYDDNLIAVTHNGQEITGQLKVNSTREFEFVPNNLLPPDSDLVVVVSANVMSESGVSGEQIEWQFSTVSNLSDTAQQTIDSCMNDQGVAMLASVNNARAQSRICGSTTYPAVSSIRWNCLAAEAAQVHTDDMAALNFFDHTGSDGSSTGNRLTRVGYDFRGWGENIALGQRSVDTVMAGWLESPGHCRNIMNANHAEFGLGYTENSNSRPYWTQVFATPR